MGVRDKFGLICAKQDDGQYDCQVIPASRGLMTSIVDPRPSTEYKTLKMNKQIPLFKGNLQQFIEYLNALNNYKQFHKYYNDNKNLIFQIQQEMQGYQPGQKITLLVQTEEIFIHSSQYSYRIIRKSPPSEEKSIVEPSQQQRLPQKQKKQLERQIRSEAEDVPKAWQDKVDKLNRQLSDKDDEIRNLKAQFAERTKEIERQDKQIKSAIREKHKATQSLEERIRKLEQELQNKNSEITSEKSEIEELKDQLSKFQVRFMQQSEMILQIREQLSKYQEEIRRLSDERKVHITAEINEFTARLTTLQKQVSDKQRLWGERLAFFAEAFSLTGRKDESLLLSNTHKHLQKWGAELQAMAEILLPDSDLTVDATEQYRGQHLKWTNQLQNIELALAEINIDLREHALALVSPLYSYKHDNPSENITSLEAKLQKIIEEMGMQLIIPKPGERYKPKIHQICAEEAYPDISRGRIGKVICPGVSTERNIIQKAQVVISKGR